MPRMQTDEGFLTHYQHMPGVDYVFASLDRKLSIEECLALHVKYFESHHDPGVPPEWALFVDLRSATPNVYPIRLIPKDATPPQPFA